MIVAQFAQSVCSKLTFLFVYFYTILSVDINIADMNIIHIFLRCML